MPNPELSEVTSTDYSQATNWLAWPARTDKPVDIFYLYPTAWEAKEGQGPLCEAGYKPMRNKARFLLAYQATAFSAEANLYAPYYRQYDARHLLGYDFQERAALLRGEPWEDVKAAFEHYLDNSGARRPFVLVGHSQGAMLVKELLYNLLKARAEDRERLVAAYVIGFSVSRAELTRHPEFPFARGADDTGVIVSYNTEAPGVEIPNPTVMPDSVVINPVSWTTGDQPAAAGDSAGAYIIDRLGRLRDMPGLADARLDLTRGTVVCSTFDQDAFYGAGVELINPFPVGIYHIYDIALYYYDLRANVELRCRRFLQSLAE